MTKKEEDELARWLQGKDVTEVLAILMRSGNTYNRRILKFFRWFCKYVPVVIMLTHMYGMIEFARHPREMVVTFEGNEPCYAFIYAMVYVLPMFLILASRFFWLCWRYRIPFFYYFGVNAIHICYGSIFTTNDMVMAEYSLMLIQSAVPAPLRRLFFPRPVLRSARDYFWSGGIKSGSLSPSPSPVR